MKGNIKIFIVEDEPLIVNSLRIDLEEMGYWCVGHSDRAEDAYVKIKFVEPDIILMDININGAIAGIQLATTLVKENINSSIIFLTSLEDDETFKSTLKLRPFDFLTKPASRTKLRRVLDLCIANKTKTESSNQEEQIIIKEKNILKKINKADIQFIEVQDKYCLVYHEFSSPAIKLRSSLTDLLQEHSLDHLMQVHRSYVVNTDKISSYDITMNKIIIAEHHIPVSKSYKEKVLRHFQAKH